MPNPSQLPYLLDLLEDDSAIVRKAIIKELLSFGNTLELELTKLSISPEKRRVLKNILTGEDRLWLQTVWSDWFHVNPDKVKLEMALGLLSEFLGRWYSSTKLSFLLDDLAKEYHDHFSTEDVLNLSRFLFEIKALRGAEENYYHPSQSNLVHVIEHKQGIPISLACVYILVGHRLGLAIEGCNLPGHFLARVSSANKIFFIDCFNKGKIIEEKNIVASDEETRLVLQEILHSPPTANIIIRRMLHNLVYAYQHTGDLLNQQFILELLEQIESDR